MTLNPGGNSGHAIPMAHPHIEDASAFGVAMSSRPSSSGESAVGLTCGGSRIRGAPTISTWPPNCAAIVCMP